MPGTCVSSSSRPPFFCRLLFAGLFVVISVYEDERKHVERNILALSNLNLATSSFSGNEIEKCSGRPSTAC